MKRLLQLSLSCNVVLLGLLWARHIRQDALTPHNEFGLGGNTSHRAKGSFRRLTRSGALPSREATPWSAVQATDPASFIANLRAIGCPEQTIRDIITLQIGRAYRNRLLDLQAEAARNWDYTHDRKDWKELSRRQSELRNEMISTMESAFGQSSQSLTTAVLGWPHPGSDDMRFLSMDQRRQVRELDQRYGQMMDGLQQRKSTGQLDPEESAQLREFERQKRAELASILSSHELEEYLYRRSPAADYVRQNLRAGSESEFRTMVKVAQEVELFIEPISAAFAGRYGLPEADGSASSDWDQRKALFDQRLKEVLGEQRIAQQQAEEMARAEQQRKEQEERSNEEVRMRIGEAAAQIGIPSEAAQKFFERAKELEPIFKPKFEELEKTLTGTPEEKKKKMGAAIKAELGPLAAEIMGEKGSALLEKLLTQDGL